MAEQYGVTVSKDGRVNKGWAGHVFERYLELPLNSAQSPNFGSWELKSIPLKYLKSGKLTIKETMAITMIDPVNLGQKSFDESHLLTKLKKAVVVARTVGSHVSQPSFIFSVSEFDLSGDTYKIVEQDYNLVRETILDPAKGFSALTGKMGTYVQPRTKGRGHGSTSRCFYARKEFLKRIISLGNE